jgi:Skp family chaperone for outer membrane proteins
VRVLVPLVLCLFGVLGVAACEAAPAESPDEVVARENARVAAAKRRAEAQDRQERIDAQKKQLAEATARAAAEQDAQQRKADAQRKKDAEKELACGTDRVDRRRHVQDAVDKAAKDKARAAELDAYVARSCQRKDVADFKSEQYVDEKGFVQTRQIQIGKHEEIACPPDAPPELRPGGTGFPSGVVTLQISADERAKNERCQDVQDLLKK